LLRARQIAGEPDRLARQQRRQVCEHRLIAAVARQIGLAIDAASIDDHRRMPDPPPARAHQTVLRRFRGDEVIEC
jgi:hypothetical protein